MPERVIMITSIKAYAKINLALNVYDRKENGYHDVDMVTVPLELHDIIELETLPRGYETYITSDDASLPTDESNLSSIAFQRLKEEFGLDKNFMIHINKRIPMCAGLGGGSADAAAVINAMMRAAKMKIDPVRLVDIASTIGGDVAFCLFNRPARCRGIGERLDFFTMKKKYFVLLIKPLEGVSTGQAYHDFDALNPKPEQSDIPRLVKALEEGNEEIIAREMKNSLQMCAVRLVPEIQEIIDRLKEDGFPMTMMSGSGSTVFTLCSDPHKLMHEAKKFDRKNHMIVLTETL